MDGKIDPFHPEAVVYERHDGDLSLTVIEYIIPAQD